MWLMHLYGTIADAPRSGVQSDGVELSILYSIRLLSGL
jgi:hypothetical protein